MIQPNGHSHKIGIEEEDLCSFSLKHSISAPRDTGPWIIPAFWNIAALPPATTGIPTGYPPAGGRGPSAGPV